MLHDRHKAWLESRKIDPVLAEKFGLKTTMRDDGAWLTLPYVENGQTVNHKYRLTGEKRHGMDTGAVLTLWNHDVLTLPEVQAGQADVLITEGEWDALAAIQCGFPHAVSVPNGADRNQSEDPFSAKRYEFIRRSLPLLDKVRSFILATDDDEPGRSLAADLARLLGPHRCKFIRYPDGCKDINDILRFFDAPTALANIHAAQPYPVKGLYRLDDFPAPPPVTSLDPGVEGLGDMFRLVPGTFTVITGYAGRGKTSLILAMLADMMKRGVPMAVASFETAPHILRRRLRAAIYGCGEYDSPANSNGPADAMMDEKLSIIAQMPQDDDAEMDLDYVLALARTAVLRDGIRLVVIDPWNEIEHKRDTTETETEYTGRAIRAMKRFARLNDCAVWLVAHPRKPQMDGKLKVPSLYDIASSAHFANKADYGVVIHRDNMETNIVEARVVKVRMGLPGKCGSALLEYDHRTSGYAKPQYERAA